MRTGSSLEDLGQRLQEAEGLDEDLALTVARNWQSLVGGLLIVLLGVWVLGKYQSSRHETRAEASATLSEIQDAYPDVILSAATDTGQKADDAAAASAEDVTKMQVEAFNQSIKTLRQEYGDTFYAKLTPLYEAQRNIATGDFENAFRILEGLDLAILTADSWPKGEREIGAEEIVQELAALAYLRGKMQDPETERDETRKRVERLVRRSTFVAVEAALMLYRTAGTEEERSAARTVAKELREERAFLATALDSAFEEAGARL